MWDIVSEFPRHDGQNKLHNDNNSDYNQYLLNFNAAWILWRALPVNSSV